MFSTNRPVDVAGSIPSEMDRTCTPRSRSRFTVLRTSIRERPSRSTRQTTTVSTRTADDLTELVQTHLIPHGFRVTRRPSPFAVTVERPGLQSRSTNQLFEALSGRSSRP